MRSEEELEADDQLAIRNSTTPIMKFFSYLHLPEHLKQISKRFARLAIQMDDELPNDPEKSAGLRKLLEAKDCFVRVSLHR